MPFWLRPGINAAKGLWDTYRLQAEERDLDQSLKEYENLEGYLAELEAFERLLAKDNLLIGEYTIKRQRLLKEGKYHIVKILWRGVIRKMRSNLQEVSQQLESQPANMLHIATILQGIRQLVGETENQVTGLQNEIRQFEKTLESKVDLTVIESMKKEIDGKSENLLEKVRNLKEENVHLKRQLTDVVCEMKNISQILADLRTSLAGIEHKIFLLQNDMEEQQEKLMSTNKLFMRTVIGISSIIFVWLIVLSFFI